MLFSKTTVSHVLKNHMIILNKNTSKTTHVQNHRFSHLKTITGLIFSPEITCLKCPSYYTYLLSCISIHQVRHHGYLSVQQWWQFQRDLVGHHHCDVHSWRTSLSWLPAKETPFFLKRTQDHKKLPVTTI